MNGRRRRRRRRRESLSQGGIAAAAAAAEEEVGRVGGRPPVVDCHLSKEYLQLSLWHTSLSDLGPFCVGLIKGFQWVVTLCHWV